MTRKIYAHKKVEHFLDYEKHCDVKLQIENDEKLMKGDSFHRTMELFSNGDPRQQPELNLWMNHLLTEPNDAKRKKRKGFLTSERHACNG